MTRKRISFSSTGTRNRTSSTKGACRIPADLSVTGPGRPLGAAAGQLRHGMPTPWDGQPAHIT
ncbi:hypothetical protein ACFQ61_15995 [Streptomyces sp. NPDC056500]|uniref:hypothetical protein n=1 Tax=Streptomyces sp. NPDC056500 TaxID=3345840 RepID=UPI003694A0E2